MLEENIDIGWVIEIGIVAAIVFLLFKVAGKLFLGSVTKKISAYTEGFKTNAVITFIAYQQRQPDRKKSLTEDKILSVLVKYKFIVNGKEYTGFGSLRGDDLKYGAYKEGDEIVIYYKVSNPKHNVWKEDYIVQGHRFYSGQN